jgi:hypothetical protein
MLGGYFLSTLTKSNINFVSLDCYKTTRKYLLFFFNFSSFPNYFRWKIRIGNENHNTSLDDTNILVLDILESKKHPTYDGASSYYDIAVLTTKTVTLNEVLH